MEDSNPDLTPYCTPPTSKCYPPEAQTQIFGPSEPRVHQEVPIPVRLCF